MNFDLRAEVLRAMENAWYHGPLYPRYLQVGNIADLELKERERDAYCCEFHAVWKTDFGSVYVQQKLGLKSDEFELSLRNKQ